MLVRAGEDPAIALIDYGKGQVMVLADVGLLGADWRGPTNLTFWLNLARHARSR